VALAALVLDKTDWITIILHHNAANSYLGVVMQQPSLRPTAGQLCRVTRSDIIMASKNGIEMT
jgi:hypothetical protein